MNILGTACLRYAILMLSILFFACGNSKKTGLKNKTDKVEAVAIDKSEPENRVEADKKTLNIDIKTFLGDKGWGYDIIVDGNKYIHQEIIPAVPGTKGFKNEEDARKTAELVADKIHNSIMPPSVTPEELDSLGVL